MLKEVDSPIEYVGPPFSEETVSKMEELRKHIASVYTFVHDSLPAGRGKSLALTHLEDACMWGIKSLVFKDVKLSKGSV